MSGRVAFKSLGCRVNFSEIDCLHDRFRGAGWQSVPFDDEADVYVINTCTVTGLADAESRKVARRAVRRKPEGGIVVVTGCYAQRDPAAIRGLDGVDLVLGNSEKADLYEHVLRFRDDRRLGGDLWVSEAPRTTRFLAHGAGAAGAPGLRTRATLKIQDGCDERCTYCIIPSVRGPSMSRAADAVLTEARHLAERGFREVALTGVNTGCWGHDLDGDDRLADLVRALHGLSLPLRYRLNSLEPATVSDALLEVIATSPSFCPHFHVPLQHGDSRVLRRMGRTYDAADYRRVIERIASRFPEAGIGADVMVGFPGETEEEFESCRHLVASLPLSYLHVFTYSERSGTPATRMAEHVVPATKQARSRSMHALEDELRAAFVERSIGTEQDVLVEDKPGPRGGLTGTFIRVELDDNRPRGNEVWRVRITEAVSPRLARAKPLVRLSTASDIADQRTTSTTGIKRSRK